MSQKSNDTNEYRKRARLTPALLVMLPVVLALTSVTILLLGDLHVLLRVGAGTLVGTASGYGLMSLLEQFGRDQGKKKEPDLWASWGGAPTTQMFRHRNTTMCNPVMRARYHEKLGRLVPDILCPSAENEQRNPTAADQVYEAWTRYLINETRDTQRFRLVFEENINYGFRRNLWGMRPAGIALAAIGALIPIYPTASALAGKDPLWIVGGFTILLNVCLLVWWLFRITPAWVFIPAKAYAERLVEALDSIQIKTT